jgi:hypothetical protein
MNPDLNPLLHFHPLIAGRLNGAIRCSSDGQFASSCHVASADWVVAFCYGHSWCKLVSKEDYLAFLSSDLGQPVKDEYTHSVPVPLMLNSICEELWTYQMGTTEHTYVLTLAVAHFSLQLHKQKSNPYALDNRSNIRRVLIRLAVFYFLMYSLTYMEEYGRLKSAPVHYVFVWERSSHFNQTGETLNNCLSQDSRFDDRNTWIEWIKPRLGVIADDSEILFRNVQANSPV